MNNDTHVHDVAWRNLLSELLANELFVVAISQWVRSIDERGRWFFFGFGGDTVMPGDVGQDLHSDYWGCHMRVMAVSIPVSDPNAEAGPMRIIPGLAPNWHDDRADIPNESRCHKVLLPKGAVFIRDINVWHSGTPNTTNIIRRLPGIRFATVRQKFTISDASIEHKLWMKYFGSASRNVKDVMKKKWSRNLMWKERIFVGALRVLRTNGFLDMASIGRLRRNSKGFVQLLRSV
jgi:hypothetical protein